MFQVQGRGQRTLNNLKLLEIIFSNRSLGWIKVIS